LYIANLKDDISAKVIKNVENLRNLNTAQSAAILVGHNCQSSIPPGLESKSITTAHAVVQNQYNKNHNRKRNRPQRKFRNKYNKTCQGENAIKCQRCNRFGHLAKECRTMYPFSHIPRSRQTNENPVAMLFPTNDNQSNFIIDSGCTTNIVNGPNLITNATQHIENIAIADGSQIKSKLKSDLIVLIDNQSQKLGKALYVPELRNSLLSYRSLLKAGYEQKLEKNKISVLKDSKTLIIENNTTIEYTLNLTTINQFSEMAPLNLKLIPTFKRWHQRLGHPGKAKTIRILDQLKINYKVPPQWE
jgi:hypothetical protein